jgi:hypothetical protein
MPHFGPLFGSFDPDFGQFDPVFGWKWGDFRSVRPPFDGVISVIWGD